MTHIKMIEQMAAKVGCGAIPLDAGRGGGGSDSSSRNRAPHEKQAAASIGFDARQILQFTWVAFMNWRMLKIALCGGGILMAMFHQGNRELQQLFGSTALADRLVERLRRSEFSAEDREFIHSVEFFFVATATRDGQPDCSFKGGPPGFVRIVQPDLLVWPDYDGNGMFKSLGNINQNPFVGLLFIRMGAAPKRLRVNGRAEVVLEDPLIKEFVGAQALIRVTPIDIFPNCPRCIPDMATGAPSPYVPCEGKAPVEPSWKGNPAWKEVVPPRKA